MKVRGLSVLTRKVIVTKAFGTEAWLQLYRDVAQARHCFRALITPDTLVPLPDYLAFHDELVRRFYKEEAASHASLGRESARWALVDGPCKSFLAHKDLREFVAGFPKFWRTYFSDTSSRSEASLHGDSVEFKVFDLPQSHPYLEDFILGYTAEVLEMFCANPIAATRLPGGGSGYHYLLHTAPAALELSPEHGGMLLNNATGQQAVRQLTNREIEVLLLVADGKTNEEIGMLLGISGKTVQHHVARVYRKINVSGRVGAAMWLARSGVVAHN
jgi:DNA-binding CsgD family transcriptional regulator